MHRSCPRVFLMTPCRASGTSRYHCLTHSTTSTDCTTVKAARYDTLNSHKAQTQLNWHVWLITYASVGHSAKCFGNRMYICQLHHLSISSRLRSVATLDALPPSTRQPAIVRHHQQQHDSPLVLMPVFGTLYCCAGTTNIQA